MTEDENREVEVFINGVFRGIYDGKDTLAITPSSSDSMPEPEDGRAEGHVWAWRGGFVVGTLIQLLMLLGLAYFGYIQLGG